MSDYPLAPMPTSKTRKSNLPPTPDLPCDDDDDDADVGHPRALIRTITRRQILQNLEREIETDEWKANAMKNNVFANCRVRKASSHGGNKSSTSGTGGSKQGSPTPMAGFGAMTLKSGKRLRLR